jgi:hypothetical protein
MKDLQNLVYKFMEREQITLKQALLQSSLGCSAKTGDIAEIVRGVVYNSYPYSDERKKRINEHLGEMLFHWVMLASTTGASPEAIISEYISLYLQRNKILSDEDARLLNKMQQDDMARAQAQTTLGLSSGLLQPQTATNSQSQASILEMMKYVKANETAMHHKLTKKKDKEKF